MTESPKTCAYPGCEAAVEPAPDRGGPPSRFCSFPEHNAYSLFRAFQRGEGDVAPDTAARLGLPSVEHSAAGAVEAPGAFPARGGPVRG
jgi:hypothetical protein